MDVTRRKRLLGLLEAAGDILEDEELKAEKGFAGRVPLQIEIRSLEFWRAIIGECIGTFFYVMLLSSTHQALNYPKDSIAIVQIMTAVTAGLAITTLTHAFMPVSGAHFNPAISLASVLMKRITILRGAAYICSHCGGAIAGAALVYGVYGRTGAKDQFGETSIANFGMEFILSFLVAYVFFSVTPSSGKPSTSEPFTTSLSIGLAYLTALTAYRGSLNPARALGPAFVADAWDYHWVFWVGPVLGACCGAFCFTFIFNLKKPKWSSDNPNRMKDTEIGSMKSDEDMIDDLERVRQYKSNMIATYNDGLTGVDSVYNTSVKPYKRHVIGAESVYGGTKSMYNGGGMYPEVSGGNITAGRRTPGLETKSMYGGLDDARSIAQSRAQLKRSLSVHSKIAARRNPQDNLPEEPPPLGDCVSNMAVMMENSRNGGGGGNMQLSDVGAYARKFAERSAAAAAANNVGNQCPAAAVDRGGHHPLTERPGGHHPSTSSHGDHPNHGRQISTSESMYREYIKQKNAEADAASPIEQLSGSSSGQCSGSSSGYYSSAKEEQMRAAAMNQSREGGGGAQINSFHHRRGERSMCSTRGEAYRRGGAAPGDNLPPPPPPVIVGEGGGLRSQNYTPSNASSFGY